MHETDIYEQLAHYLNLKYPGVVYHFDLSGVHNPSHKSRNLYSRLNQRAWPDLFVAPDLFIEIKKDKTRVYRKDGELVADEHIREQAHMLQELRIRGFKAYFGVGFDQCQEIIDEYLQ